MDVDMALRALRGLTIPRGLDTTQEPLDIVTAEIQRLRAIVDKLPKTADGVPVVPNVDSVWVLQADEWREVRLSPLGGAIGAPASECYSSLEAAKQAEEDVT